LYGKGVVDLEINTWTVLSSIGFGTIAASFINNGFNIFLSNRKTQRELESIAKNQVNEGKNNRAKLLREVYQVIAKDEIDANKEMHEDNKKIKERLNEIIETQGEQKNENERIANSIELIKTQQTDKWEQKKIDADIISKSIVDWLELAREIASSISSSASETNAAYILYRGYSAQGLLYGGLGKEEEADIMLDYMNNEVLKATQSLNVFFKSKYKFKLLFGKNKENDNLLNYVEKIEIFLSEYAQSQMNDDTLEFIEKSEKKDDEFEKIMDDFIEECRIYFKAEWVKAKKGTFNSKLTSDQRPFK
jgi:hypothetical protein